MHSELRRLRRTKRTAKFAMNGDFPNASAVIVAVRDGAESVTQTGNARAITDAQRQRIPGGTGDEKLSIAPWQTTDTTLQTGCVRAVLSVELRGVTSTEATQTTFVYVSDFA